MKRHGLRTAACLLLAGTVLAAFVAVAADVGSQEDPLVTLSYLSDTFLGQLLERVDRKVAERDERLRLEMEEELLRWEREGLLSGGGMSAAAASYTAVTLYSGQSLYGEAGCEVLLRSGQAVCSGTGAALTDVTSGTALSGGGALAANHLYLLTDSRAITVSGDTVLLVRGSYTVG